MADAAVVPAEDRQEPAAGELRVGGEFLCLAGADRGNAGPVSAGDDLGCRQVREQRRDPVGGGWVTGIGLGRGEAGVRHRGKLAG